MKSRSTNLLSPDQEQALLSTLKARFNKHMKRHKGIAWEDVQARLEAAPAKLWSLYQMEASGGEPDVVSIENETGEYVFYDCAPESPKGRRSLCYDDAALESRKEHPPKGSAVGMAAEMGAELLDEAQYRALQEFGPFDAKTSSWIQTPDAVREHGGALFGDYRYAHTFIYHNGAQSYYAARSFRSKLKI
jgi:hypothetical protein